MPIARPSGEIIPLLSSPVVEAAAYARSEAPKKQVSPEEKDLYMARRKVKHAWKMPNHKCVPNVKNPFRKPYVTVVVKDGRNRMDSSLDVIQLMNCLRRVSVQSI